MKQRLWLIGPSGSGKTTIITTLQQMHKEKTDEKIYKQYLYYAFDADKVGYRPRRGLETWTVPSQCVEMFNQVSEHIPVTIAGISSNWESQILPKLQQYKWQVIALDPRELTTDELATRMIQRGKESKNTNVVTDRSKLSNAVAWYQRLVTRYSFETLSGSVEEEVEKLLAYMHVTKSQLRDRNS